MSNVRILVVEDEVLVAQDLAERLKSWGYEIVAVVHDAHSAIHELGSKQIDLVLLDIRLDGEADGIEVASHIQNTKPLPVIFLTSLTDKHTVDRARTTYPSAYMIKPFTNRELQIAMEMAISNFSRDVQLKEAKEGGSEPSCFVVKDRIFIKRNHRFERVDINDILWIEAESNCTSVVTRTKKYLLTFTLGTFHERLNHNNFIRVHRSYVINLTAVDSFEGGRLFIGTNEIPVSKAYRDDFMRHFTMM